jgi:hypothetical protein
VWTLIQEYLAALKHGGGPEELDNEAPLFCSVKNNSMGLQTNIRSHTLMARETAGRVLPTFPLRCIS